MASYRVIRAGPVPGAVLSSRLVCALVEAAVLGGEFLLVDVFALAVALVNVVRVGTGTIMG